MLKLPCVKAVFVPDPWLIKKFSNEPSKVILRNFISNDIFSVDTTSMNCTVGDSK
jgi:hypothetical protein